MHDPAVPVQPLTDATCTFQYRNNMILKKRFGDISLGKCDVMLSDIADSRRIDNNIHQSILQAEQPDVSFIRCAQCFEASDIDLTLSCFFLSTLNAYDSDSITRHDRLETVLARTRCHNSEDAWPICEVSGHLLDCSCSCFVVLY